MGNREIKFRIWNNNGRCMHEWRELVEKNKIHLLADQQYAYPVMQYTGLKDANGVEIYDGDIVEYFCDFTEEVSNHQVKYFCNDDYPAFDFSPSISDDMNGFSALAYQEIGTVKVIGNIYQNTELLNG